MADTTSLNKEPSKDSRDRLNSAVVEVPRSVLQIWAANVNPPKQSTYDRFVAKYALKRRSSSRDDEP